MRKTNLIALLALVIVFCLVFAACNTTKEKADNSISGMTNISATCGDTVPKLNATAAYGEVSYGLAQAAEGTAKESLTYGEYSGTLTYGTYYVKASVAEGEDYKATEAYATITVSHQAFDKIAGNGDTKHETTAEGKYRVWTEKKCACGVTIVGNETIADKLPATISGIADIDNAKCGYVVATDGITSDKGTLTFAIATATEGTAKEDLTYAELGTTPLNAGVYYLKASVAEGEDFAAATAYAKITVTHKAFEEIGGDATFVAPVFDAQTKGYYKKQCACGQDVNGSVEFVSVRVTVNGKALTDQVVEIGGKLVVPTDLPQAREGYAIVFSDAQGQQFDFTAHTVNDFETIALTSSEYATEVRNGKYLVSNDSSWLFIIGSGEGLITAENVSVFTQKDGCVEIQTNYLPEHPTGFVQLSLGNAVLDAYHEYTFTFKATQGTYVWFGDNFDTTKFTYTDEMAEKGTEVVVHLTSVNGDLIANFDGQELNFGKVSNLSATTLRFQDKDENVFANRGKRYTITLNEMVSVYDYMSDAKSVLATIPTDVADITVDNAFSVEKIIEAFDNIANKHFSASELTKVAVNADVRAKVEEIVDDPLVYLNYIIKDLPDFDNGKAINPSNEAQLYQIIVDYVGYAKTMLTAEQLETYKEPRNVSLYRYYFFKNRDSAVEDVLNNVTVSGGNVSSNSIVLKKGGRFVLPALKLDLYQNLTLGFKFNPSTDNEAKADASIVYNGKTSSITKTTKSNWAQLHVRKIDGVWYAQLSDAQSFDKSKAVELSADVVNGKEGIAINFTVDSDDTITVQFDRAWGALSDGTQKAVVNTLVGKLVQPDVNVYTVVYNYKTESGADDSIIYYYIQGEQLVLPQIPAEYVDHHTYKLDGWFAGTTEYKGGETVSSDLEIAATYSVKTYETHTVEFYLSDSDSEAYATKTINYGDKLVLPKDPTKDPAGGKKYKFAYWKTADGTIVTAETIVEDDMQLTAVFVELKQVTVTYTNLNGDDIVDDTYCVGERIVRPADPTRDGFAFMGWYTTAGEEYLFDSFLDENGLTLVAKWYKEVSGTEKVLYTASELITNKFINGFSEPEAKNIADLGEGKENWFFDSDYIEANGWKRDLYSTVAVMYAIDGTSQLWTLPKMVFDNYRQLEFGVSAAADKTVTICGHTFASKSNMGFVIKNGVLNVYDLPDHYVNPIASITLPEAVRNGSQALEIQFSYNNGTRVLITEFHGTEKYVDYVAEAIALDAELSAWINANVGSVSAMTAEQKATFATKLNKLYIARGAMTTYEASKYKISDVITYVHRELAKLDDAYFDMFSAVSDLKYDALFRKASDDKSGQAVMNAAYEAFNKAETLDYFAFVTDGTNTSAVSLTLPAINFEALNMTFSFNFARQGTENETLVTLNGQENASKLNKVGNNLQYCFVMSIYKDATKGWVARWHSGSGTYDYTVQLTEAQANGREALTFNVTLSGPAWFTFFITNISATF